jgi:hypothetical protein
MAMTQAELNRAVAKATGESIREIERRGFALLTATPVESEPCELDWDAVQAQRQVSYFTQRGRKQLA